MKYQEYIDLGFKRIEMNDNVEFKQTGYSGFCLEKKVNKKLSISVCSGDLDKPKLYVKKQNSDTYHIIPISFDIVKDLLFKEFTHTQLAC